MPPERAPLACPPADALGLITIAYVGRLGQLPLSIAILATSIFNAAGLSILTGLAAAMETFCGCALRPRQQGRRQPSRARPCLP